MPIWLAAATLPWGGLPRAWWLGFAGFAGVSAFAPPALRIGALVAAVALTGNPAWRGAVGTATTIDAWLAIALAGLVLRPVAVATGELRAARRAAASLGAFLVVMAAAWLVACSRELDVLSTPFRTDLAAVLGGIGHLADQTHPLFGLRRLLDLYEACGVGVAVAALSGSRSDRAAPLPRTLACVAGLALALGIFQAWTGWAVAPFGRQLPDGSWQVIRRVNGTAPDANAFAASLVLMGPPLLASLARLGKRWPAAARIASLGGATVCLGGVLVMTGSRAVLGAVAAQAAWSARGRLSPRAWRHGLLATSVVLAGMLLALRSLPPDRLPAHATVARFVALLRGEPEARRLVSGRLELWRAAWLAGAAHPLTGVGPGNLYRAMPRMSPALRPPDAAPLRNAHDQFLQIAVEGGPLALVVFVAMVVVAFRGLAARAAHDPEAWGERSLALGLVGEGVMMLVGHPMLVAEHLAIVLAVLGHGLGVASATPDPRRDRDPVSRVRVALVARLGLVACLAAMAIAVARNVAWPPPITLHGAYAEEWTPTGESFRWLGPSARLVIDGRRVRRVQAEVSAAEPDLAVHPVALSAVPGDVADARVQLRDGDRHDLAVTLPAGAGRGTEIALRCDRTFRPCDVWTTGDCRTLCARLWRVAP
ncbi:MAG: O-antigen ligase family protein [bacterium]